MGLNTVLESGCPAVDGGQFFSPFPGLDWTRKNVPDFFAAAQRFGIADDDIALVLWGIAQTQHELFKRYEATYGKDLTREDFRDLIETQTGVKSGVFPDSQLLGHRTTSAPSQVHVLKADCAKEQYKTVATFATGF